MGKINCYFAISRVCNLRCRYCYVPEYNKANQSDYDARAVQAAQRFADKVRRENLPVGHISLHGAEPTILSPEALGQVITVFAELTGQTVRMQSNATRLTQDYLDRLLQVIRDPELFFVGVSMDGCAAIHNPNRNKTWDLVFNNLFELKDRGFHVGLLAVISSLTIKHLKELGLWLDYIRRIVDTVTFKMGEHGFGLTEDEKIIFARWLCDTKAIPNLQGFMPDLCIQDGNDCSFFEFDIDGNAYSCNKNFNADGIFANWFDEPFEAILAKREGLYAQTPISPECRTCALWVMCHSGCPMSREDGKSVDCRVKKEVYAHLPLESARLEFNPSLEVIPDSDSGHATLAYHNARRNDWEELVITPEASRLITLFLKNSNMTVGEGLRRFAATYSHLSEETVANDAIAFLKTMVEKTVVHSFW